MKLGRSVLRLMNLSSSFLESRRAVHEQRQAVVAERDASHAEVSLTFGRVIEGQNESDSDELMHRSTR